MCGISGFTWRDERLVQAMNERLRHRGPDDAGIYTDERVSLGHRRLSILDLSPAGHQPMASQDGRLVIVFNGEIYNFQALRTELERSGHVFRSHTDTEVILAAYREWGADCVRRFDGMWAFCLYDIDAAKLFCSRDRFGIKPFVYRHDGRRFIFASEIKALLCHDTPARLNRRIAFDYLVNNLLDHCEETFYEGIRHLPAAHNLTVELATGALRLERYYEIPRIAASAEEFGERLRRAVESHMIADVPVGSCLSGGLDSSTIVALASHGRTDFHTFSAVYGDDLGPHNERSHIDTVTSRLGVIRHDVHPSSGDFASDLPGLLASQDEPLMSTSPYAQYKVFELARRYNIPVLLDGQGADEVLWGYHSAQGLRAAMLLKSLRLRALFAQCGALCHRAVLPFFLYGLTPAALVRHGYASRPLYRMLRGGERDRPFFTPRLRDMRDYTMLWLTQTSLPQLLRYEDSNSMAHSIESRVPFLDHHLVELGVNLPDDTKLGRRGTKQVLRETMDGRLPDSIVWRKDKVGFATPEDAWMDSAPALRLFDETLTREARIFSLLDADRYRHGKAQLRANGRFRLLCLEFAMRNMNG